MMKISQTEIDFFSELFAYTDIHLFLSWIRQKKFCEQKLLGFFHVVLKHWRQFLFFQFAGI